MIELKMSEAPLEWAVEKLIIPAIVVGLGLAVLAYVLINSLS